MGADALRLFFLLHLNETGRNMELYAHAVKIVREGKYNQFSKIKLVRSQEILRIQNRKIKPNTKTAVIRMLTVHTMRRILNSCYHSVSIR